MASPLLALTLLALPTLAEPTPPTELDTFEMIIQAVERCQWELQPTMLMAGMAVLAKEDLKVGSCSLAFDAYASASPETKQTLVASAFEDCDLMCPAGRGRAKVFEAAANASLQDRTGLVVEACDARGPEPVYTGPLAELRPQMNLVDYWVSRSAFDLAHQRLVDRDGSPEALAIWRRYEAQIPGMAERYALHQPPQRDDLQLPGSNAVLRARPMPTVMLTCESLLLDGSPIARLEPGGTLDAGMLDASGIRPLVAALGQVEARVLDGYSHHPGENALLQAHHLTPHATLVQVASSLHSAGYDWLQLAVQDQGTGEQAVVAISLAAPSFGADLDLDMPPLNLSLLLKADEVMLVGAEAVLDPEAAGEGARLPIAEGRFDTAALGAMAARVKDEYPDEDSILVVADPEVPLDRLVAALDATRAGREERDGSPRVLFPRPTLVGAAPLPRVEPLGQGDGFGGGLGSRGSGLDSLGAQEQTQPPPTGTSLDRANLIILGALDRTVIWPPVEAELATMRSCYDRARESQPALQGRAVVKFVIDKDGAVSSSSLKNTSLNHPELEACVLERFQQMAFPAPEGGGIVIVSAPVSFEPTR